MQGELAEVKGIGLGGFRNPAPNVFHHSRDFQYLAQWSPCTFAGEEGHVVEKT